MDPVEVGFGHDMWYESDIRRFKCSFHDLWSRDFLAAKPEDWGAFRKDAFVTFETTTLTVAAFVVSPQIDALPDLQTLVRATFTFTPAGKIEFKETLMTTTQTFGIWKATAIFTVVFGVLYLLSVVRRALDRKARKEKAPQSASRGF